MWWNDVVYRLCIHVVTFTRKIRFKSLYFTAKQANRCTERGLLESPHIIIYPDYTVKAFTQIYKEVNELGATGALSLLPFQSRLFTNSTPAGELLLDKAPHQKAPARFGASHWEAVTSVGLSSFICPHLALCWRRKGQKVSHVFAKKILHGRQTARDTAGS